MIATEFHETKQGVRVVRGDVSVVLPQSTMVIDGESVTIKSVGKPFPFNGGEAVYGYLLKSGETMPDVTPDNDDGESPEMLTCEVCGVRFARKPGPGRPPKYCPEHRDTRPEKAPVTPAPVPVTSVPDEEEGESTPAPVTPAPVTPAVPATARKSAGTPEEMIAEALRLMSENTRQALDPDAVRAIVDGQLAEFRTALPDLIGQAGIRRIEMVFPDRVETLPETAHEMLPEVVQVVGTGLHAFLVGPAGSGKSTIAEHVATALGIGFQALSMGPTTQPHKFFGYMDATGNYVTTPFRKAYEDGELMLVDEIDNGHPGLIAELNQAIANGYAAFADGMVERHKDFRLVATGNTFGRGPDRKFSGRNRLDFATLDRFATIEILIDEPMERRVALSYVPENDTQGFARVSEWVDYVQAVRERVTARKLEIVVSPRSSIDGAKLLLAGMSRDRVEAIRLFAGLDTATLDAIR